VAGDLPEHLDGTVAGLPGFPRTIFSSLSDNWRAAAERPGALLGALSTRRGGCAAEDTRGGPRYGCGDVASGRQAPARRRAVDGRAESHLRGTSPAVLSAASGVRQGRRSLPSG